MTERRVVKKVLTLEIFRWDRTTKTRGPVETTVKGWDAVDEFFKSKGTALVREKLPLGPNGIDLIRMPEGWDSMVVAMENFYDDGTSEEW